MKIDTHVHSKYSADSRQSISTIFRTAKKRGLSGIAVTDHNAIGSWQEAKKISKRQDLIFIQGEEISILESGLEKLHTLGFFMTDFIEPAPLPVVYDQIKGQGALLIICHPFEPRRESCTTQEAKKLLGYFNGVETFNARVRDQKWNDIALKFAKQHKLTMTGGSDAHLRFEVGNAYTECKGSTLTDFRNALKKKKTTVHGKKTHDLIRAASMVGKI
jgi:predicted metal-dependent phosphoesterase TrpH